jgi:hypothetical protein
LQANIPASEAASLWPKIEQIATAKNLKIVSPAVNYCGMPRCNNPGKLHNLWYSGNGTNVIKLDPFSWLDNFFGNCTNCTVDYVAAHWYACSDVALMSYLYKLRKYGKPIWLTGNYAKKIQQ